MVAGLVLMAELVVEAMMLASDLVQIEELVLVAE